MHAPLPLEYSELLALANHILAEVEELDFAVAMGGETIAVVFGSKLLPDFRLMCKSKKCQPQITLGRDPPEKMHFIPVIYCKRLLEQESGLGCIYVGRCEECGARYRVVAFLEKGLTRKLA